MIRSRSRWNSVRTGEGSSGILRPRVWSLRTAYGESACSLSSRRRRTIERSIDNDSNALMVRLLDGNGLSKIARLVHIASATNGYVVGEQLKRYRREDRREQVGNLRHIHHVIGFFCDVLVAFGRDRNHDSLARFDLLDVAHHLFAETVLLHERDDRHLAVN